LGVTDSVGLSGYEVVRLVGLLIYHSAAIWRVPVVTSATRVGPAQGRCPRHRRRRHVRRGPRARCPPAVWNYAAASGRRGLVRPLNDRPNGCLIALLSHQAASYRRKAAAMTPEQIGLIPWRQTQDHRSRTEISAGCKGSSPAGALGAGAVIAKRTPADRASGSASESTRSQVSGVLDWRLDSAGGAVAESW
jgi:hypothetical protein